MGRAPGHTHQKRPALVGLTAEERAEVRRLGPNAKAIGLALGIGYTAADELRRPWGLASETIVAKVRARLAELRSEKA